MKIHEESKEVSEDDLYEFSKNTPKEAQYIPNENGIFISYSKYYDFLTNPDGEYLEYEVYFE